MSVLVVTIHALLIARAQVQGDRDTLQDSYVNQSTGVVDDESAASFIADYDRTLATIDEALERAKQPEMTLRDRFAAQALQGLLPMSATYSDQLARQKSTTPLDVFLSVLAYRFADAMLAERRARAAA